MFKRFLKYKHLHQVLISLALISIVFLLFQLSFYNEFQRKKTYEAIREKLFESIKPIDKEILTREIIFSKMNLEKKLDYEKRKKDANEACEIKRKQNLGTICLEEVLIANELEGLSFEESRKESEQCYVTEIFGLKISKSYSPQVTSPSDEWHIASVGNFTSSKKIPDKSLSDYCDFPEPYYGT